MAVDNSWVERALLIPLGANRERITARDRQRYGTSAGYKHTNSRIGGNFAINTPYQFTRWADIRQPPRGGRDSDWVLGQGSYYSEAIDDTRQEIHMCLGVPQYNSLVSFIGNFYDAHTALLANTGRVSEFFYNAGDLTGFIFTLPFQPFIYAGKMAVKILDFVGGGGGSKWYYFKPAMHTYWQAVNNIANTLAINIGIAPRILGGAQSSLNDSGSLSPERAASMLHEWMPHLFGPEGGIDVMNLSREAQRTADAFQERVTEIRERASDKKDLDEKTLDALMERPEDPNPNASARELFLRYGGTNIGRGGKDGSDTADEGGAMGVMKGVAEFTKSSMRDGSQFVTFRVANRPQFTESFSNSTKESAIAGQINGQVASAREARFSLMDGNVAGVLAGVTESLKSFAAGALDSVGIGGLAALSGSAYIDVPKTWDNSTANLPTAEYTIPLSTPYGNKVSRFMDIMLPIACILAAALPRSAGPSAYTSPPLCQIFHRGRVQCKNGMIREVTITRGNGNVGFNADDEMLNAEITFSVVDMSSIMHVPIMGNFHSASLRGKAFEAGAGALSTAATGNAALGSVVTGTAFDEESVFQDYLGVLGGLGVQDSYYRLRRLNLNMSYANAQFRNWSSPSNFMSMLLDTSTARAASMYAQTTDRFKGE